MTVYISDHWVIPYCTVDSSRVYSAKPVVRLITTFACITLPELCVDFCMVHVVQHFYPGIGLLVMPFCEVAS